MILLWLTGVQTMLEMESVINAERTDHEREALPI